MTTPQNIGTTVVGKLRALGVSCTLSDVVYGPQVIRIEVVPEGEVSMRQFRRLDRASDLAYALSAKSVRILAPIPGRSVVGIEVDRKDRVTVGFDELPSTHPPLLVPLGLDIEGRPVLLPIDEAPHILCAGATGSGKSTCLNAMLCSLISALTPQQLSLVLVDPKQVEFAAYEGIAHLAAEIADSPQEAMNQLHGMIDLMQYRYSLMRELGVRNLKECNATLKRISLDPLSYVVIVVDELAELMMTSRKEVESLIVRLAQKGRAAGIHLVLATQYPKAEVVSGLTKANLPTRIAFAVPNMTTSRVILDQNGAETLLGRGDGLLSFGGLAPVRFQGAYVTHEEIESIAAHWKGVLA